jgi:hypothetical protein
MPGVGFELTIAAFERAKTVWTLDRATTVICFKDLLQQIWSYRIVPMMMVEVLGLLCDAVRITDCTPSDDELEVIWKEAVVV